MVDCEPEGLYLMEDAGCGCCSEQTLRACALRNRRLRCRAAQEDGQRGGTRLDDVAAQNLPSAEAVTCGQNLGWGQIGLRL